MFWLKRKDENSHIELSPDIPNTTHCAMGLSIDLEAEREHIVIGEMEDIYRHLAGIPGATDKLLVNETRPLGKLVEDFFDTCTMRAKDAATGFWPETINTRPDLLIGGAQFVEEVYQSDNLLWRFLALRLWQEYRAVWDQPDSIDIHDRMDEITYPMRISHKSQIETWDKVYIYSNLYNFLSMDYFRYPAYVMYQNAKPLRVYHVTDLSGMPLYIHYLNTVDTKRAFFQYCKRCGKLFIANTNKVQSFCSDECRKAQQKENRKRYSDKVEDDEAEKDYRATYMYWYNRMKKFRQSSEIDPEKLAELEAAFEQFRNEATKRKNEVQHSGQSTGAFKGWLFSQRGVFDGLTESLSI